MLDIEAVFHTYSGYMLAGLVKKERKLYYAHCVDLYDGMILYAMAPIDDNQAEILMRNEIELRQIVEIATHTVEFNTTDSTDRWVEIGPDTLIALPAHDVYLYAK